MSKEIFLGNVMVDCDDERKLCDFYSELLGWVKLRMYGHLGVRSENGMVFLFAQEDGYVPPVWPERDGSQQKQIHFDYSVPD